MDKQNRLQACTELAESQTAVLPPWLLTLRAAAEAEISEADVRGIVRAHIDKAKAGDTRSAKFVFDKLLGGDTLKGATFNQNNFYGPGADPRTPTAAPPGSNGKLAKMQARAAAGLPLCDGDDATERGL